MPSCTQALRHTAKLLPLSHRARQPPTCCRFGPRCTSSLLLTAHLTARCSPDCSLLITRYSSLTAHYSLLTAHCSLRITRRTPLTAHCPNPVLHSLFTTTRHCSLFARYTAEPSSPLATTMQHNSLCAPLAETSHPQHSTQRRTAFALSPRLSRQRWTRLSL